MAVNVKVPWKVVLQAAIIMGMLLLSATGQPCPLEGTGERRSIRLCAVCSGNHAAMWWNTSKQLADSISQLKIVYECGSSEAVQSCNIRRGIRLGVGASALNTTGSEEAATISRIFAVTGPLLAGTRCTFCGSYVYNGFNSGNLEQASCITEGVTHSEPDAEGCEMPATCSITSGTKRCQCTSGCVCGPITSCTGQECDNGLTCYRDHNSSCDASSVSNLQSLPPGTSTISTVHPLSVSTTPVLIVSATEGMSTLVITEHSQLLASTTPVPSVNARADNYTEQSDVTVLTTSVLGVSEPRGSTIPSPAIMVLSIAFPMLFACVLVVIVIVYITVYKMYKKKGPSLRDIFGSPFADDVNHNFEPVDVYETMSIAMSVDTVLYNVKENTQKSTRAHQDQKLLNESLECVLPPALGSQEAYVPELFVDSGVSSVSYPVTQSFDGGAVFPQTELPYVDHHPSEGCSTIAYPPIERDSANEGENQTNLRSDSTSSYAAHFELGEDVSDIGHKWMSQPQDASRSAYVREDQVLAKIGAHTQN